MLRKLWTQWLVLARKIGKFQSRIILTVFYFVIVTPFGLGVRLFADPLRIRRALPVRNRLESPVTKRRGPDCRP